jgi:hypothetical protein
MLLYIAAVGGTAGAHEQTSSNTWYVFGNGIYGQICATSQAHLDDYSSSGWRGIGWSRIYVGDPCIYAPQQLPANTLYNLTTIFRPDGSQCAQGPLWRYNSTNEYEIATVEYPACTDLTGTRVTHSDSGAAIYSTWYWYTTAAPLTSHW